MLRSMYSGISGMKNFQTKLDVIGNNIANVNTYGFKKGRVTFKDTMNQTISGASAATDTRGGKNPMQVGLGSTLASIDTIDTQGSLQTTGRSLDLALNGDGYFVVRQGNQDVYTRAGNFYLDNEGTLVNSDGLKLQAYAVDQSGVRANNYGDVTVNVNAVMSPTRTTTATVEGTLSDVAAPNSKYVQQIEVVRADGTPLKVDITFTKNTAAREWSINGTSSSGNIATPLPTITFDATTRQATPNTTNITIGGETFALNMANLTSPAGNNQNTAIINTDGNLEGSIESFNIGAGGEINGVYSNGLVRTLGVLAIAKFSNPAGLTRAGGNNFQQSINSGVANTGIPGEGRGTIAAGALEMSNVDLSEEFTEMITAQRGFQANTRIITTSDEILQELVNLKR
ncbi:flagellar hook protein FlgE [Mangrovibacillus cuniculi]|uniref:Flagellar hook protein FlgE n=1 Tax=Mangrovibacillus cuniculi TaxID=2593652 RepID=A0A7S8CAF0_9BACI|nr:flagellar hook-basal body complex protein [Mangrovibacillus cuniculi]QPC46350.1 flagellar hook-basal body complex protein [Mangrovibacillus cuniculi]